MTASTVFVQRLFDSIFVYVPRSGLLRRVKLESASQAVGFCISGNRSDTAFETRSKLFETEFYALVAMFVLCDKKQKHSNFDPRVAMKVFQRARESLFGDIGQDFAKKPVVADDLPLGRQNKGQLYSVQTSTQPIIFVTSADLRALPLETMFPDSLVLRCWSFVKLMLRPNTQLPPPRPTICRWKADRDHLMQSAVKRSFEEVERLLQACGSTRALAPYVDENERGVCFPFPLFSSNVKTAKYQAKYPFCDFIDVAPDSFPQTVSVLFIFTYSDFCEMPLMLEKMVSDYPFAFYMFIPAQFVREAFGIMVAVFERQEKRIQWCSAEANRETTEWAKHWDLCHVPFDFLTLLQGTLMLALGCPIPVITPGY
jgi:hypothetical protein